MDLRGPQLFATYPKVGAPDLNQKSKSISSFGGLGIGGRIQLRRAAL